MLYLSNYNQFPWFRTEGTSLLILESRCLSEWRGALFPEALADEALQRVVATDYDRILEISQQSDAPVKRLPLASGDGIVLDAGQCLARFFEEQGLILSLIVEDYDDAAIASVLRYAQSTEWENCFEIQIHDTSLAMIDSAYSGAEYEAPYHMAITPGEYTVQSAQYSPAGLYATQLMRFFPRSTF